MITAAAIGFVYLYVVPQLHSSLTAEKLERLEQAGADESGRLADAMRRGASERGCAASFAWRSPSGPTPA